MRREILKYYYSLDDGTWLCDKSSILQSSKSFLSKFMHSYNFINKKHINEKDKEPG